MTISAAVDRAEQRGPAARTTDDERSRTLALAPFIMRGRDDAGQRHHRADRQVDAAGDDDDRLGGGGEGERQDRDREALDRRAP